MPGKPLQAAAEFMKHEEGRSPRERSFRWAELGNRFAVLCDHKGLTLRDKPEKPPPTPARLAHAEHSFHPSILLSLVADEASSRFDYQRAGYTVRRPC